MCAIELAAIDRGAGDVIALVHGGVFHSGPAWAKNIGPLVEDGYRVLAVDRRGHGRSPAGEEEWVSVHLHAEDLRLTFEHREISRAHLVGVSYGALVALEFALSWPSMAWSMTLLEPPLFTWLAGDRDFHEWFEKFLEVAKDAKAGAPLEDWVPRWLRLMDGRMADATNPGSPVWAMVERQAHLILKEEAGWEYEPNPERLEELQVRTFVMNGHDSEPPMHEIGEMLAERLPLAVYHVIPGGHDAHARSWEQFDENLLEFLYGFAPPS
jgi:3-oxoadipate enol-lactonase